jgi:ClpP class serine protease
MLEWLLELSTWKRLEAALKAGTMPTDKQVEAFTPLAQTSESDPRILTRADDKAEILVEGILTERFDFMAYFVGGGNTTYQDIRASLALADQDKTVKEVTMVITSPGGALAGLFETIQSINDFSKPIKAVVRGQASSAAYALAAATDSIETINKSDSVGSVGIVAIFNVDDDKVSISSTKAPKKAPDVTTEAGKKIVTERLDELHALFAESIATGRGTTVKKVNADFGRGAEVLAEEALKNGMIDKIQSIKVVSKTKPRKDSGRKEAKVNLAEFKTEYPGIFAEALVLGVVDGVKQERDRAGAHLVYGEASGAMKIAIKAVKDGTEMTETLRAEYMTAGRNRTDVDNRTADEIAAAAAADGAETVTEKEKDDLAGTNILEKAAANCNVKLETEKVVA